MMTRLKVIWVIITLMIQNKKEFLKGDNLNFHIMESFNHFFSIFLQVLFQKKDHQFFYFLRYLN